MTPLIPPDMLFPLWVGGTVVVVAAWYIFFWVMGRDVSDAWRPALYSAVGWPLFAVTAVAVLPLFVIFKVLRIDK